MSYQRSESADEEIGRLEEEITRLRNSHRGTIADNNQMRQQINELVAACTGIPRFDHAMKLVDHLQNGPGVMLYEAKKAGWLKENPWPTDEETPDPERPDIM